MVLSLEPYYQSYYSFVVILELVVYVIAPSNVNAIYSNIRDICVSFIYYRSGVTSITPPLLLGLYTHPKSLYGLRMHQGCGVY